MYNNICHKSKKNYSNNEREILVEKMENQICVH